MKYRKKPVVVEAVRYRIDECLPDWFMNAVTDNIIMTHGGGTCYIKTPEGTMKADFGDYIIRGIQGEIYPCKPDIFKKTYVMVEDVIEKEECEQTCAVEFEELEEGMWIWDNQKKLYGKVAPDGLRDMSLLSLPGLSWGEWEDNRYYLREIKIDEAGNK